MLTAARPPYRVRRDVSPRPSRLLSLLLIIALLVPAAQTSLAAPPDDCALVSPLVCASVPVSLPFSLGWDSPAGGLLDSAGSGTGFTMADPPSSRLDVDGPISNVAAPGYEPSRLSVSATGGGTLTIATNRGIQYRRNGTTSSTATETNSLINGLGVGVSAATQPLRIETTVLNPPMPSTNNSEQAGLWFGLDEDNYLKVVVVNAGSGKGRIQFLREVNGLSGAPADELYSADIAGVAGTALRLALVVNPATRIATAYVTIGGGSETVIGSFSGVPSSFFAGKTLADGLTGPLSFAGIFATHRRSSTSLNFSFGEFSVSPAETTPPAAPSSLVGSATSTQIDLDWADNSEPDLLGYNVYRSLVTPVSTAGTPLNGATPLLSSAYSDLTAQNGTLYSYAVVAVDRTGNLSAASSPASAQRDSTAPPSFALPVQVNFQDESSTPPAGYLKDYGQGYANLRGFGWVVPGSSTPRNLIGNGRNRNLPAPGANQPDLRLATLLHMQADNVVNFPNVAQPGAWEIALPNGSYAVTVAVGDANLDSSADSSRHSINVEGISAIDRFVSSGARGSATRHSSATVTVSVSDGRLTIDANGGFNTKIDYLIIDAPAPAATATPTASATATPTSTSIAPTTTQIPSTSTPTVVASTPTAATTTPTVATSTPTSSSTAAAPTSMPTVVTSTPTSTSTAAAPTSTPTAPTTTQIPSTSTPTAPTATPSAPTATPSAPTSSSTAAAPTSTPVTPTIAPAAAPPAAPGNVAADAGDGQITLTWAANSEPDLRGYNVYRSTTLPVSTGGTPLNGSTPLTVNRYVDGGLQNGVTYYYVITAVNTGGQSAASSPVGAMPQTTAAVDLRVNFQDQSTVPPSGYLKDFGEAYGARSGAGQGSGLQYGWVAQADLSTPLSLVGNGRNRNVPAPGANQPDLRLATLLHMQLPAGTTGGNTTPGAWQIAVPNGSYQVTVSVGDAGTAVNSVHQINIEGQAAIIGFVPTSTSKFASATRTVNVADGALTIDATGGTNTKVNYVTILSATNINRPSVSGVTPANGARDVARDTAIAATVNLPNVGKGVDSATLSAATVRLLRTSNGQQIAANANTSGGGDVIVLQPSAPLDPNTSYTFEITDGVKDISGAAFLPFTSSFTTGAGAVGASSNISFTKVAQPASDGKPYSSLLIGPDGKLYASTLEGEIIRFTIAADGALSAPQTITTVQTYTGTTIKRALIGMAFDPASTAATPILWVSHSFWPFDGAPDWSGKITRLSGANLETAQDYVVNLPRSIRDHMSNSLAFGPDGKLYLSQGSNSAMGAPDSAWGSRSERLLNGSVLRIDTAAITPPLDVKTEDGGSYRPFATGAPVTIYASGIRNAYDLVWHSNGQLYAPANGSAAGGSTPGSSDPLPASCQSRIDGGANGAYVGPAVPALTSTSTQKVPTQNDYLFRVVKGGYYGHPNPQRCEWVLNGGNPSSSVDPAEVTMYPIGTSPDRNWRGFAYDFQNNKSPNGAIEYTSSTFGGALKGRLLVVRYSGGKDIIVLTPGGPNNDIVAAQTGLTGLTGFVDPLDLVENRNDGSLYVAELISHTTGRITLLRPDSVSSPQNIAVSPARLIFNDVQGGAASPAQQITITNSGSAALTIPAGGLTLGGTDAAQFQLLSPPALPTTIAAGASLTLALAFNPPSGAVGVRDATLQIASDDPDTAQVPVRLRGLGTQGLGGASEPSLQWIVQTYEYPLNIGDSDPTTSSLPATSLLGEEISVQRFQAASDGPVTIEPLAVFGPQSSAGTVLTFGSYTSGSATSQRPLFSVANAAYQTLNVAVSGSLSFDPGGGTFGFYSNWPYFSTPGSPRDVFSEDALNTWESNAANRHKLRVYRLKDSSGAVVQNAYLIATEETTSAFDYQDMVVVVRNVRPALDNAAEIAVTPGELVMSGVKGTTSPSQPVTITNSGSSPLTVSGISLTGANASAFTQVDPPALPLTVAPGGSATLNVAFTPGSTTVGSLSAALRLLSDDADEGTLDIGLYGLSASGIEGSNEPPLKQIVDTLGHPINVGGSALILGTGSAPLGDEISAPLLRKAGSGPVTLRPVARYSPDETLPFGYYTLSGANVTPQQLAVIAAGQAQTLNPATVAGGASSFDPGSAAFGLYVESQSFGRRSYTQDGLNTGPTAHAARIYPNKDRAGQPIADSYLVAFEDSSNGDYQDYVFEIGNVRPAGSASGVSARINFQPDAAAVPTGYTKDAGLSFDATRGYGWVVPGSATPVDMSLNGRERNQQSDQRLDTFIIMQGSGAANQPNVGAWEYALPGGSYRVTVSVGDPGFTDSTHRINVEGVTAINNFVPSAGNLFASATVTTTVSDGRLTLDATGGSNTKIDYVDITSISAAPDTTPPTVNLTLSGTLQSPGVYRSRATATITAADSGGSGLQQVSYSLNGAAFQPYSAPLEISTAGSYTLVARALDGAGNLTTSPAQSFSVVTPAASKAEIELENLDGVPFADRLVFSRIQNPENGTHLKQDGTCCIPANVVHDLATVRVRNTGSEPLTISALTISSPASFKLEDALTLPSSIAAGAFLDVRVRFIATGGDLNSATLTISSDDADEASTVVQLAGFWQSYSEGGQEPDFREIVQLFGYGTTVTGPGQSLSSKGKLMAVGDEILSPYWQRADTSQGVTVRQLAAYHTQGNSATFYWTPKSQYNGTAVLTHVGVDGQTVLPRKNSTQLATVTFTPSTTVFGFRSDPEHSDYAVNTAQGRAQVDYNNGCVAPCGHHFRIWPARDRSGAIIPNTYLMTMDYSGINYDFQDNVYLVSNIRPENAAIDPSRAAPLPGSPALALDFNRDYPGTLADKDSQPIGFSSTQPNKNDIAPGSDSFKPALLDIDTAGRGTLAITSFGTATTGSNIGSDNTLVNGVQQAFDGSAGSFTVAATLLGPLNTLTTSGQQAGVMLGGGQNDFVKLTASARSSGPVIELYSEQLGSGGIVGATVALPSPATLQTLELLLLGDPASRTIRAAYRIDGGALTVLPTAVTITSAQAGRFFGTLVQAGLIASSKNAPAVTLSYDRFAVTAGDASSTPGGRQALYRLDVAGASSYTDTAGQLWTTDSGLFTPGTAISEGANVLPQEIANTDDDVLYRTYRGNVGSVPLDQRVLTYNLPLRGATSVDLRLHFAERYSGNNAPGKRLFDIEAEGRLLRDNFDIFAASGGTNTAIVLPLDNVAAADGVLNLTFRAAADYPSIAAIEVLCRGVCPAADTTPPAAPIGLSATAGAAGVALDWADNSEADLVGYNVYRSSAAGGPYTLLTATPLSMSAYTDSGATAGATAYYRVTALDSSGNESAAASASATMPAASAIRINAGGSAQTVGGVSWSACSSLTACGGYVSGGFAYSTSNTISGVVAPANQALYQSEWTGGATGPNPVAAGAVAFSYNVPVASGSYRVRLHFAELNKTGAGLRVFDVNIEGGAKELTGFDIYAAAGGINKAIVREFDTTVSDGNVTIQFIRQIENAKISAIEIIPLASATPTPGTATPTTTATATATATPTATTTATPTITPTTATLTATPTTATSTATATTATSTATATATSTATTTPTSTTPTVTATPRVVARINAGGPAVTTGGVSYSADQFFSGGYSYTNPNVTSIAATTDDTLYLTERSSTSNLGSFSYAIPLPAPDSYRVRLHFAEIYHTAAGRRVFSVNLEDGPVELPNFDIVAAVGTKTAVIKEFTLPISDGTLNIQLSASVDRPKISAIEVIGLGSGTATPTPTPTVTGFSTIVWSAAAAQPYSNSEAQGAVVDGKLYIFGGFDSTKSCCTPTRRSYVYDPATNAWTARADMPAMGNGTLPGGLTHAGTTTDGTAIYFAGGYTANAAGTGQIFGTKEVWKYAVATNSYTRLPDLPIERAAGQLALVGRELHFIGGTNLARTQDVGDHYVLNLDGGTSWTTRAALPNPRHHAGAAVIDGYIYYIGGQRGHDAALVPQSDVHRYDPATDSWTAVASLAKPTNHAGAATFVLGGQIIVVGGQMNHNQSIADVVAYNPITNSWSALTPLPSARHSAVAAPIDGTIYYTTGGTTASLKGQPQP